ncbi:unnamed protein product, partial [Mesorhabditis belari]|uniref:Protein zwilch n=1 Tax=Mesorhabditis belari TaxID=2138241 RepID=A0AAF3FMR4_9BILA
MDRLLRGVCDDELLLSKYRVRIVDKRKVPIFEDSTISFAANQMVVVIDLPKVNDAQCPAIGAGPAYCESDDDENGPLHFSFLTLDKLDRAAEAKDTRLRRININYATIECFETTPIPCKDAIRLCQKLVRDGSEHFDASINKFPMLIVAEASDGMGSVYFGLQRPANGRIMSLHTRLLGSSNAMVEINQLNQRVTGTKPRCEATAIYNLYPRRDSKEKAVESGELIVTFNWQENAKAMLTQPASSATGYLKIQPGWRDSRFGCRLLVNELDQILAMCNALLTNDIEQMKWPKFDSSNDETALANQIHKIIDTCQIGAKDSREGRFLDMTEQLWGVLKLSESHQQLVRAIRLTFTGLADGKPQSMIHENNKTTLARLIRDACNNELILPRLEGLTSIQILAEIGAEKVARDIKDAFVKEKLVRDEDVIMQHLNFHSKKLVPVEERAAKIRNMLLALQTMLEIKYLLNADDFKLFEFGSDVVNYFADMPQEKLKKAAYVKSIPFSDFNSKFFQCYKPLVWMNEIVFNCGGNREIVHLVHFTKYSRLDHLNALANTQKAILEDAMDQQNKTGDEKLNSPQKKRTRGDDFDKDTDKYIATFTTISTMDLFNHKKQSASMDLLGENTNTFSQQHFGFSPAALTDSVHNIIVENWARMVEEMVNDEQMPDNMKTAAVSQELTKSLLKDNLLHNAMNKFEDNLKRYVMRIPEHVTLPEHESNLEVPSNFDDDALEKEITKLEQEVVKRRVVIAHQDVEERDIHDAITIMQKMNQMIADEESYEDVTENMDSMNISGVPGEAPTIRDDQE